MKSKNSHQLKMSNLRLVNSNRKVLKQMRKKKRRKEHLLNRNRSRISPSLNKRFKKSNPNHRNNKMKTRFPMKRLKMNLGPRLLLEKSKRTLPSLQKISIICLQKSFLDK